MTGVSLMHLMIEGVGGNPQRLFVNADYYIPKYLRKMVSLAGMTPISDVDFHQSPGSSAGIILLAESHASLHAQQEQGMTFIDLFTLQASPGRPQRRPRLHQGVLCVQGDDAQHHSPGIGVPASMATQVLERPADAGEVNVFLPKWGKDLLPAVTYKSVSGGRDSAKTWTVARLLVAEGYRRPIQVACLREFQENIEDSVKKAIDIAINDMGLSDFYDSKKYTIDAPNGTAFRFRGMERNKESMKGLESFNRVWVEQAERLSEMSADVMIPTFIRVPGIQFYFTWNPEDRTDWVWRRFVDHPREDDIYFHVTYRDNPWFNPDPDNPSPSEKERLAYQDENPGRYPHLWEGEPNDEGGDTKVLPFPLLQLCIKAYREGRHEGYSGGRREVGLDIADTGSDWNVLSLRRGPILEDIFRFRSDILATTSKRADRYAEEHDAARLNYDVGGMGAGVRSDFAQMPNRHYAVRPELFGGKVKGPETQFSYRMKNKEFFSKRNAQLGWAVRLRAENTKRLMAGEEVDLGRCLFINPEIPGLSDVLAQMAQPTYRENPATGKTELLKRDENEASPDFYDGAVLAFASDSDHGLSQRRLRG